MCHCKVPHEDVPIHHAAETCPSVEVPCTNNGCSMKIYRGQLNAHQNFCPRQIIPCPYHEAGCTAQILRENLQTHLTSSINLHCQAAMSTILKLKKELSDIQKKYKDVEEKLQSGHVPPITFKLFGYRKLKSEKKLWRSPFFFSHQGGYKFQLHINPSGSSTGDFLSAFLYIASGPNDNELVWPFSGTILTIQLVNQYQNSEHHSKDVKWNSAVESAAVKPVEGSINVTGLGFRKFINHSELEGPHSTFDREFIHNDCLFVRVSRVSVTKQWFVCTP